MGTFFLSLQLVSPVFLLIFLGAFLKKIKIIDDNFTKLSSKLVFNVALPVFIFFNVAEFNLESSFNYRQIIFVIGCTVSAYFFAWIFAKILSLCTFQTGVFIQGAFRGNFAIVGIAIISAYFSDEIMGKSSVLLAVIVPLYNILSLIALLSNKKDKITLIFLIKEILKNPLIICIAAAIPFSINKIELPKPIYETGNYIADLTLPLALLSIGGTMNFSQIKNISGAAVSASILKTIIFPFIFTYLSYILGYRNEELGMLFILFSAPTAIVSFIMTNALGGDEKLAGNIIVMTTLLSVVTMPLGIFVMEIAGLVHLTE
ncbi:MAG: AEC family transporter [Ignavibacteria bacterium]|nr:AEC family transporter [Ignavibacteria bacterium]